jgi:hypothetical protein
MSVLARRSFPLLWLFMALALAAYALPWVINTSAALTLNGYDLAEWISLHPAARNQEPILLTSLLLRLPLLCLCGLIAIQAQRPLFTLGWWLRAIGIALLVLAQLPPLEFANTPNDPNYQQQLALALVSLVLGGLGLSGILARWRLPIALILVVLGCGASLAGLSQSIGMMNDFSLAAQTGSGIILYLVLSIGWLVYTLYSVIHAYNANRAA